MNPKLEKLRIKDLKILKLLGTSASIRELARQLNLDPQNLTRRISFLEESLGGELALRSVSGITLTQWGSQVSQRSQEILDILSGISIEEPEDIQKIRVCSRAYLVDFFIDHIMVPFCDQFSETRFKFMDSSPELTERVARKGQLDVVISLNDILLGDNFKSISLGKLEMGFFVRKGHPLCRKPVLNGFEDYPLIGFSYLDSDRIYTRNSPFLESHGGSPGFHSENSRYSIKILKRTNSVAFIPKIAAYEEGKNLVELNLPTEVKSRDLYLHVNIDTLKMKQLKSLEKLFKKALKEQQGSNEAV